MEVHWCLVLQIKMQLCNYELRATSHTRLRARDHCTSSTLIGAKGGAGPSSLPTTLEGPTELCECKMDVKSTWIPTCHQMDHVSWSLEFFFKKHLLEVGLTQNRETMALLTLTTTSLFCFYHV
jgi:hypothetical protein